MNIFNQLFVLVSTLYQSKYLYTCQYLTYIFNYLMEYSFFFLLFFWKHMFSENDCLNYHEIYLYTRHCSYIYSLSHELFFLLFWKHMFSNDCFNYHEIFITRQSYIYINYLMEYSFFFSIFFMKHTGERDGTW